MGYTTYFDGEITFDKPLTPDQISTLQEFQQKDHRDEPWAKKLGVIWCQWEPTSDGKALVWDQGEKFYDYDTWMQVIMDKFIKPWGLVANGSITWDGEDSEDQGVLDVTNNEVSTYNIHERAQQLEDGLDKLLSLVPDQLPLLLGINAAMDKKIKEALRANEIAGKKIVEED